MEKNNFRIGQKNRKQRRLLAKGRANIKSKAVSKHVSSLAKLAAKFAIAWYIKRKILELFQAEKRIDWLMNSFKEFLW